MQESAVDGNQAAVNNVALRNVRIQAQQNSDFLRPGTTVDLVLVAVNQSPDITDKLVGVTTDIGKVTVTGDPTCRPAGRCSSAAERPDQESRRRRRGRRHRQGDRRAEQADHQRPELQLHLQLREGRQRQPGGADLGAGRAPPPANRWSPDLSARRIPSPGGQGAFAVPLFGMPPCHRQMGRPLPGVRHLGLRRRSRGAQRCPGRQPLAGSPSSAAVPISSIEPTAPVTAPPASMSSTASWAAAWYRVLSRCCGAARAAAPGGRRSTRRWRSPAARDSSASADRARAWTPRPPRPDHGARRTRRGLVGSAATGGTRTRFTEMLGGDPCRRRFADRGRVDGDRVDHEVEHVQRVVEARGRGRRPRPTRVRPSGMRSVAARCACSRATAASETS